jgi:hypothetical protein
MPDGWTATLSDDRDDRSIVFAPPSAGDAHATANYDTSDGFPPSDRDPSTGAQYGEAI